MVGHIQPSGQRMNGGVEQSKRGGVSVCDMGEAGRDSRGWATTRWWRRNGVKNVLGQPRWPAIMRGHGRCGNALAAQVDPVFWRSRA